MHVPSASPMDFIASQQQAENDRLLAEAKQKATEDQQAKDAQAKQTEADKTMNRDLQRQRQKQAAAASAGRAGTILTAPQGVQYAPDTAAKSILGG